MNWIQENKFLSGFLAAVIVGVGVFGYLLYSAMGAHEEISTRYTQQAAELKRLQGLQPYPDEENLKKVRDQKQAVTDATATLRATLSTMEFPVQPMTPEQFQDRLRAAVTDLTTKMKAANIQPPKTDRFYMGFEEYQATLPKPEAAPLLGRQLQAIDFVLNVLVNNKVDALNAVRRTPLPEEGLPGATGAPSPAATGPGAAAKTAGKSGPGGAKQELVSKLPFEVEFTSDQAKLRKSLNDIVSSKQQFYIVRSLVVSNEKQAGPPKAEPTPVGGDVAAPPPTDASGSPAPAASPSPAAQLRFVLGTEKVNVGMRVDVVSFAPAATPTPAAGPKKK